MKILADKEGIEAIRALIDFGVNKGAFKDSQSVLNMLASIHKIEEKEPEKEPEKQPKK